MAAQPISAGSLARPESLLPFSAPHASRVASWIRDREEAFWIAPRSLPPLSTDRIRQWAGPGRQQWLLAAAAALEPAAYGELNVLNVERAEYWLGHLIVDPKCRGLGLGQALTRLLMDRARHLHGAKRVTLVVFPQNTAAIACYEAAGLHADGYETHFFAHYGRRERLLRMTARL